MLDMSGLWTLSFQRQVKSMKCTTISHQILYLYKTGSKTLFLCLWISLV